MIKNRSIYVPQHPSELRDLLSSMLLQSPTFLDKIGYFPDQSIDSVFFELNEGLLACRTKLGQHRYEAMRALSAQVWVTEIDPINALQAAMEGFRVVTMDWAADKADIFVTATGNYHVITHEHMKKMKDQAASWVKNSAASYKRALSLGAWGVEGKVGPMEPEIKPSATKAREYRIVFDIGW